mmetsp:Transcript_32750/g.102555  ORF Transcript_32750/g.102555 Transcript_32750/m.102555 type:complete len:207 (+) Transcript_32750:171-791(+)
MPSSLQLRQSSGTPACCRTTARHQSYWSRKNGTQSMGTPQARASCVELAPQCEMQSAVLLRRSTACWGTNSSTRKWGWGAWAWTGRSFWCSLGSAQSTLHQAGLELARSPKVAPAASSAAAGAFSAAGRARPHALHTCRSARFGSSQFGQCQCAFCGSLGAGSAHGGSFVAGGCSRGAGTPRTGKCSTVPADASACSSSSCVLWLK